MSTREAIKILRRQKIIKCDNKWEIDVASKKDIAKLELLGIPMNGPLEQKAKVPTESEASESPDLTKKQEGATLEVVS